MEEYQNSAAGDTDVPADCEGRKGSLAAKIAVDGIDFRPIAFKDPMPLGRQILREAGLLPVENYQLYAVTGSGDFEDVRLEEPFDLCRRGVERFIAFSSDRIFRLMIDDREVKWGVDAISEQVLRYLGGVPEDQAVFLEIRGGTDRVIAPGEVVDLTGGGVERFISARRPVTYIFFVDGKKYETALRTPAGRQIKAMVDGWDPSHDLVLEGHRDDPDRVVGDDEVVDLETEHGHRRFSSVPKANFG